MIGQYREGTVTTNGTAVVTGSGTSWLTNAAAGNFFTVQGSQIAKRIQSVDSDTQITLESAWTGASASGQAYAIGQDQEPSGLELDQLAEGDGESRTVFNRSLEKIGAGVAGYLSLSVAGSSNVTLTPAQYKYRYIKLTGALTGSINVIVPAKTRGWLIENATTGSYTITVKTASGTGIAVTQGTRTALECDGTNVVASITSLNTPTLVSPTLSGTTTAGAINASGLLALTAGINIKGSNTFSAASNAILGGVDSGNPHIFFVNSAGAADEKVWDILVTSTQLQGRAVNDTNGAASNWLTVSRTGTAPVVSFPNGINSTVIGATTPAAGSFTTLSGTDALTLTKSASSAYFEGVTVTNSATDGYAKFVLNSKAGGVNAEASINWANGAFLALVSSNTTPVNLSVNGTTRLSATTTGVDVTGALSATTTIKPGGYTVATLPAGSAGMHAYVTDATAPTYLGALTGGGAVKCPVFYGAAWVSH